MDSIELAWRVSKPTRVHTFCPYGTRTLSWPGASLTLQWDGHRWVRARPTVP